MVFRLRQFWNIECPVAGGVADCIVMLVRPEQEAKALSPIEVAELGIIVVLQPLINLLVAVSIMALQFSRES